MQYVCFVIIKVTEVSKMTKRKYRKICTLHLITPCHSCKLIVFDNLIFKLNVYVGTIHCVESEYISFAHGHMITIL